MAVAVNDKFNRDVNMHMLLSKRSRIIMLIAGALILVFYAYWWMDGSDVNSPLVNSDNNASYLVRVMLSLPLIAIFISSTVSVYHFVYGEVLRMLYQDVPDQEDVVSKTYPLQWSPTATLGNIIKWLAISALVIFTFVPVYINALVIAGTAIIGMFFAFAVPIIIYRKNKPIIREYIYGDSGSSESVE